MNNLSVSLNKKEVIFGVIYMLVQLFVLPSLLTWGNWLLGSPLSVVQLNFVFFALNFIVITVAYRRFLIENLKMLVKHPWWVLRFAGAGLLLYWVGNFLVSMLIMQLSPSFTNANDQSIMELTQDNVILMSVGTVLLVPVVEETLYRGVLFGAIYRKNAFLAYTLSTVVFSSLHIIGYLGVYSPLELLLSFLQYVPAGLCLAWSYQKSDSIWAPILIHIAVNQMGNLAMR